MRDRSPLPPSNDANQLTRQQLEAQFTTLVLAMNGLDGVASSLPLVVNGTVLARTSNSSADRCVISRFPDLMNS